ncbi:MAG: hypothetical protein EXQ88_04765 [Alphaproteobacteria bacterium]|nr:hypothetical protein [Alphaproteobacteria bacterium]
MLSFLQQKLALEAILPALAVAVLLAGLLAAFAGPRLAGAALAAGFLAGYAVILGWPGFPPSLEMPALQKLPYIASAALLLGIGCDVARLGAPWPVASTLAGATALWLGWRGIAAFRIESWLILGAVATIAGLSLPRLQAASDGVAASAAALVVAAASTAALAFHAGSGALAQLAGALAAATGGFALWNWPRPRHEFSAVAVLGGGGVLVAIATQLALFEDSSRAALAIVFLALLAPQAIDALLPMHSAMRLLRPILVAGLAMVPGLAAWALARGF